MPDPLAPERFADFYREIWARKPYQWQERAAAELADGTIWQALSAPTGAGKTTLIECVLFALAYRGSVGGSPMPRRLFWVIDRRSVADQVCEQATHVAEAINSGNGEVIEAVRGRLAAMAGVKSDVSDDRFTAVRVRLWRGGLTGEAAGTAHDPLSPCAAAVICTTIDQIGSRMLFRGYGVAPGSRPIEAALTATDSLIVLDEAHLSRPFRETAEAIRRAQRLIGEQPVRPLHVLPISATPDQSVDGAFELTEQELAEPALARRFKAPKPVTLRAGNDQVKCCAREARELANVGARVVGVIVNTVATARWIHGSLRRYGDVVLLIGPVRPLDRPDLLKRIPEREERRQMERPLFVVGTQTIEVGVDLDLDALVTACAPFPSLVQRFGRLDRTGKMDGAGRGVIVEPPKDCRVYGEATAETWKWLQAVAAGKGIDLGPAAIECLRTDTPPPEPPAQPQAPILGPWHLERLLQTSHTPRPDPDVAVFLHGERALDNADVQICWRADLDYADDVAERVRNRPPHPGELLSLSPGAVRRWLKSSKEADDDLSDVESLAVTDVRSSRTTIRESGAAGRWALRVQPPGADGVVEVTRINPSELRPGDVIVVPARYGGCDEFGWAPDAKDPVQDLGNLAFRRPRILLPGGIDSAKRLGVPEELRHAAQDTLERLDSEELDGEKAYDELLPEIASWLNSGGGFDTGSRLAEEAIKLGGRLEEASRASATRRGRVLVIDAREADDQSPRDLLVVAPSLSSSRSFGMPVLYQTHVAEVSKRTQLFADRLGLSEELAQTITLAARNHDAGKLDRRFQTWLNNGVPLNRGEPLAKSGCDPWERRSLEARDVAEWPEGKRHESTSAMLVSTIEAWPAGIIRDLLIHLVLAHHGDGRPFYTAVNDPEPVEVTAPIALDPFSDMCIGRTVTSDSVIPWHDHVERFIALNERFGPWGLAALETILVLADRSISAEEGL